MEREFENKKSITIITAGSTYLDIDAYACMVTMAELLNLQGANAIAYSKAPCNYSVCESVACDSQIATELPVGIAESDADYIIVDVSDPEFLKKSVPLDRVVKVFDHHVGFEEYWNERIGEGANIEFIGAAATLIYREWKKSGLQKKMAKSTARLLIAAILDNTLNLTSSNTTPEDVSTFNELCLAAGADSKWCASYFTEVQVKVEEDLKNALFNDIKNVRNNKVLPSKVAQLCVWDAQSILGKVSDLRKIFEDYSDNWMINIIDIKSHCSYFVCDNGDCQKKIENIFNVIFNYGIAKTDVPYLRKEIIKRTEFRT